VVRDSLGNEADSGWSGDYRIDTFVNLYSPVAVMPVSNISKQQAPYAEMRSLLKFLLIRQGLDVISDEVLERFLEKHRIRYTGGLNRTDAQALEAENVARAVLITSLEHYDKMYPPRIALTARLVSTGESPEILWVDSIAMAGHDTPKLLNLGMISSHRVLLQKAVKSLADSFDRFLQGKQDFVTVKRGWLQEPRFEPKIYYHAGEIIDMNRGYTVAVLPFFNLSERAYAGDLIQLHFAREMGEFKNFNIIEPGIVRDVLLKIRAIMYDGISLEQAQVIFSILQADFILTGTVLDYNDYSGEIGKPTVDFSALLIERQDRQTLWTSKSYNKGDDDVFFFDLGKINTANTMAAEMVRIIVEMMVRGE
jgi:TolB-like protein